MCVCVCVCVCVCARACACLHEWSYLPQAEPVNPKVTRSGLKGMSSNMLSEFCPKYLIITIIIAIVKNRPCYIFMCVFQGGGRNTNDYFVCV